MIAVSAKCRRCSGAAVQWCGLQHPQLFGVTQTWVFFSDMVVISQLDSMYIWVEKLEILQKCI